MRNPTQPPKKQHRSPNMGTIQSSHGPNIIRLPIHIGSPQNLNHTDTTGHTNAFDLRNSLVNFNRWLFIFSQVSIQPTQPANKKAIETRPYHWQPTGNHCAHGALEVCTHRCHYRRFNSKGIYISNIQTCPFGIIRLILPNVKHIRSSIRVIPSLNRICCRLFPLLD